MRGLYHLLPEKRPKKSYPLLAVIFNPLLQKNHLGHMSCVIYSAIIHHWHLFNILVSNMPYSLVNLTIYSNLILNTISIK